MCALQYKPPALYRSGPGDAAPDPERGAGSWPPAPAAAGNDPPGKQKITVRSDFAMFQRRRYLSGEGGRGGWLGLTVTLLNVIEPRLWQPHGSQSSDEGGRNNRCLIGAGIIRGTAAEFAAPAGR